MKVYLGYIVPAIIPVTIKSIGYAVDIGGILRNLDSIEVFSRNLKTGVEYQVRV